MLNVLSIEEAVENGLTIIVDTREQDTVQAKKRLEDIGLPIERKKLDFGDYSCKIEVDGKTIEFDKEVVIERKMDLDELCACFTRGRARFEREFERAKKCGAKTYLLIENASIDRAYSGAYRSQMKPSALIASITTWLARYNCQVLFCLSGTSGKLIAEILKREAKERLKKMLDFEQAK